MQQEIKIFIEWSMAFGKKDGRDYSSSLFYSFLQYGW